MNPTQFQGNPHYIHNNDYNKHKHTKEITFTKIASSSLAHETALFPFAQRADEPHNPKYVGSLPALKTMPQTFPCCRDQPMKDE